MSSPNSQPRADLDAAVTGALVALACAAVHALRAAPTTYLLDSSELVATTWTLAVSHAPGHPAYHLAGFPFTMAPVGGVALRIHLFGVVTTSLAVGLLPWCARQLGWAGSRGKLAAAGLIALAIGLSPAFALQSIRAEVYSLNLLTVAVATAALATPDWELDVRRVGVAAVALGVGLLDHHYLVLWTFPAFLVAIISMRGAWVVKARAIATGISLGGATLVGYAYLLARGAARPAIGWGWPSSAEDVWWVVSAQAFQKTAGRAADMDVVRTAQNAFGVIAEQMAFAGVSVALVGLGLLLVRRKGQGWFLGLAIVGNLVTQVIFDFDPNNPDVLGYFMPAVWWLALCACYAIGAFGLPGSARRFDEAARVAGAALVALTALAAAATSHRTTSLNDNWDSELLRDEALARAPAETLWVTAYFETGFDTWYGQTVEDRRPDITHVHQTFRTYPFYDRMALALHPELADVFGSTDGSGLLAAGPLVDWARRRPVRVEPEQVVDTAVAAAAIPAGMALQLMPDLLPAGEFPPALTSGAVAHYRRLLSAMHEPPELQTRRNLLWNSYNMRAFAEQ